jgi:DNA-binding transcriptional ArsR family regulator
VSKRGLTAVLIIPIFPYRNIVEGSMSQRYFEKKAEILKAIAQPTRLKILELLKDGERCVCEIYPALEQEQPNISKHLNFMKRVGILDSRKEGLRIIYWIKAPEVSGILHHAEAILHREVEDDHRTIVHT